MLLALSSIGLVNYRLRPSNIIVACFYIVSFIAFTISIKTGIYSLLITGALALEYIYLTKHLHSQLQTVGTVALIWAFVGRFLANIGFNYLELPYILAICICVGVAAVPYLTRMEDYDKTPLWKGLFVSGPILLTIYAMILGTDSNTYLLVYKIYPVITATLILGIEAYQSKNRLLAYLASWYGIWFYKLALSYFKIYDNLINDLPIAGYFMVCAYLERKRNNINEKYLDILGFIMMFLAIFSRIPGNVDGVWYALLLAAFGIGIAFIGVTSNTRRYKTIGTVYIVIAALSQTYNHIPQWAVIGIAGLLILGLGVYLLSKKKN
jgi:hypothetical protein